MKDYRLEKGLNQKIVDGIFKGYREYLDVRREKAKSLKVSGAYAWVKGNHIDHHVGVECEPFGVKSKLAKAGLTWQYLQFKHQNEAILFIVKNARYFDPDQVNRGKDATGKARRTKISYMENLMTINKEIDFNDISPQVSESFVQLELQLIEDCQLNDIDNKEISKIKSNYNRFYIVTYLIDENQYISKIQLWMPNPVNNQAYLIDNLTFYINESHAFEIEEELKDILVNKSDTEDHFDAHKFGIVLDTERKAIIK
ncbi:hypothetical protein H1Z61_13650 [Bacillus aquiflavi]|uniref:Uncharacterized protein n=1 Tax=Bacillus aquiflavi TaxID=2672567 RepID=A0A6B3W3N9_9BACI|nr:hypothetical protein [Bacillus aquiflavi]MBA4538151.1 hypothetical protein [Bacillus aquiflavi]NEY82471.1 hypothetical protein [Bacillus aquiflavi]UAC48557.1 hypothetical protein K6959_00700 [Bacillus aquiflavi]